MASHDVTVSDHANEALEKHVRFWDRKNKGYITPVDAMFGFMNLGYSVVFSLTMGTFLGVLFSYATQASWVPDPYCRTRVSQVQKTMSTDTPYDDNGRFDEERFDALFSKYGKSDISGRTISLKELMEWNDATLKDPLAWATRTLEWLTAYMFVGKNGIVKREDVHAAFDGTLFYKLRERNRQSRAIQDVAAASTMELSGVKVPKSFVRHLENHLNQAVHLLPRSTVDTLNSRFRHWYAQMQDQTSSSMQPILKGVATPQVQRPVRGIFRQNGDDGDDDDVDASTPATLSASSSLTGVKTFQFLDTPMTLAGLAGYEQRAMDEDDDDDASDHETPWLASDKNASPRLTIRLSESMTGLRPEGDEFYADTPRKNWLRTRSLTGVATLPGQQLLHSDDDADSDTEDDEEDGNELAKEAANPEKNASSLPVVGISHSPSLKQMTDDELTPHGVPDVQQNEHDEHKHEHEHEHENIPGFTSSSASTAQDASPVSPLSPEVAAHDKKHFATEKEPSALPPIPLTAE
ncbi:Caleosin related protein-domain-containing protein [Gongronella butleri]|nr:Caleosin related protein-domain-containing protein [Gongronella butleri]